MELSINAGYFMKKRGTAEKRSMLEAAKLCKNAGFRLIDCTPDIYGENWEVEVKILSEQLHTLGITVDQSHAPFNRYKKLNREIFEEYLRRSFEAAAIMGAKHIIVHADEYIPDKGRYDPNHARNDMYDFYAPYVELAKKRNLGVAIENLFEDGFGSVDGGRSRFTSTVEELLAIIKKFNDPAVTCCWDFGHANVAFGNDPLQALKKVGPLVSCTHVHDNYYGKDLHLPPFLGEIDWEAHIRYLKEIHYPGSFTYEFVYGGIPEELLEKYLCLSYETGEYLISLS